MFEKRRCDFRHLGAVVDNQHCLTLRLLGIHGGNVLGGDLRVGTGRQIHRDRRSLPDFAFRRYRSAGLVGKTVNLRQTEPRALADFLGREKWIEDLGQKIWRNAHAGIAEVYRNEAPGVVIIAKLVIGHHVVDG